MRGFSQINNKAGKILLRRRKGPTLFSESFRGLRKRLFNGHKKGRCKRSGQGKTLDQGATNQRQ
jgi:hypothetical protein